MAEKMKRSDDELRRWANEHLVYEAMMLLHTVQQVADQSLSDADRNAFIESFAVHVRCLRDFLWGDRRDKSQDAFASDFCAPGVWAEARPELPAALREIEGERNRIGREIVHLTYHRLDIDAEAKEWDAGELLRVIADALAQFSELTEPERLPEKARETLTSISTTTRPDMRLLSASSHSGVTGASQTIQPERITGGTIPFPGHTADTT